MIIKLHEVMPAPLKGAPLREESLWGKTISISSSDRTLVEAESGSGKTTLIALLYGLRNDYSGGLEIDGRNARNISLGDWSKLRQTRLAIVLQDLRLFPDLTARENLLKLDLTKTVDLAEAEAMADRLEVAHKLDQPCRKLSQGQQQRFAIIRALCQSFELLLMDEPFSHLDARNTALAGALIEEKCEANQAGVVLTTLGEAAPFATNQHLRI